ncbi:MAG: isoprenyl transferase [Candidatus Neomarinimicrobiota bacterium]
MNCSELRKKILKRGEIPKHIAIIMDGNGRWAKNKNLPRLAGHKEGINSVREITRVCGEMGVGYLTLFTFSVENWNRPRIEVSAIMKLLLATIRKEVGELQKNNVRLTTIGNINELGRNPRKEILAGIEKTRNNTGLNLILALSYGSRQELLHAVKSIAGKVERGELKVENINEKNIQAELYTASTPDPDLLIRTGGEQRISNFLLWQAAYTEILLTDTFWPDFRELHLLKAVESFQCRERRYGLVSEQIKS